MAEAGRDAVERPYRSIREVLDLLVGEFPDVTISKIRFLESRGLIHPERTPSGYRKFYEQDVERLRWILRQQREHFLPLKVIKGRLDQSGFAAQLSTEPSLFEPDPDPTGGPNDDHDASAEAGTRLGGRGGGEEPPGSGSEGARPAAKSATPIPTPAAPSAERAQVPGAPAGEPPEAPAASDDPTTAVPREAEETPAAAPPAAPKPVPAVAGANLSAAELAGASGASPELIATLVDFGLLSSRLIAGVACFDEQALALAKVAAGFARFGIEPRHLTAAKHAATRQAGLYAQVVAPLLRQRNPEARTKASADLAALVELGATLHRLLVDGALRDLAGG